MPAALDLARDMARPAVRSMLLGSTALTRFGVNGVEAALALDFISSEYRTGNTATTFADAFMGNSPKLTYNPGSASSSQSTMVNSEGKIVWAPHNLLDYSEDFSQSLFQKDADVQVGTTNNDDPAGGNAATQINVSGSGRIYANTTAGDYFSSVYIKPGTFSNFKIAGFFIDLDATPATNSDPNGSIVALPDNWFRVTVKYTGNRPFQIQAYPDATYVSHTQSGDYQIWGAHLYRSDLGGMAPVPGAVGDFQYYVPTNGAAVYLPRVGHHVYNGSTWVNEGLLIESEARTNLFPVSTITAVGVGTDWDGSGSGIGSSVSVAASVEAPDGTTGAVGNFVADANATSAYFHKDTPLTSGVTYTQSVFAKPNGTNFIQIAPSTGFASAHYNFDLVNLQTSSSDAGIEDVGNGWVRCSVTVPCTITTSVGRIVFAWINSFTAPRIDSDAGGAPNGTDGVYVWGAQLEQAPTPSSYIPTNGSTVTRGGQSLTVPPAEFGWPEPEVIGPELVTNGTFDTDLTGWTINYATRGTAVASGGRAVLTNDYSLGSTAGFTGIIAPLTTVAGRVYEYKANLAGTAGFSVSNNSNGAGAFLATTGTGDKTVYFVASAATTYVVLYVNSGSDAATASFDNISVREINPRSVSIQMDGRMTYADDGGALTFTRWSDEVDNSIELFNRFANVNTGGSGALRIRNEDPDNIVNLYSPDDTYSPGVLVPFNIASRHGSTFVNGAVDGVALTADTTPTALPDLSNTDLQIAYDFMGTIGQFRQFAGDIGDAGLVTATNPSTEPTLSLTFNGTGGSYYNLNWSE